MFPLYYYPVLDPLLLCMLVWSEMRFDSDPQIRGPGRSVEVRREVWIVQPATGASQSFALLRFVRKVHEGLEGVWSDDCGRNSFGCWDQKERRSLLTVLPAPIIAGLVF
jgi:hypothetical protein